MKVNDKKNIYRSIKDESLSTAQLTGGLDNHFDSGYYLVEINNKDRLELGLPVEKCGHEHYVKAHLFVTDSGNEDRLQNNRVIGQTLVLSQCCDARTSIYSRSYSLMGNEYKWSLWNSTQQNIQVGQVTSLDGFCSSGLYSGVYSIVGGSPETFVLTVIDNDVAATTSGRIRCISQFKNSLDVDGTFSYKTRVGRGKDTIIWGNWVDIAASDTTDIQDNSITAQKLSVDVLDQINKNTEDVAKSVNGACLACDTETVVLNVCMNDGTVVQHTIPAATVMTAGVMTSEDKKIVNFLNNALFEELFSYGVEFDTTISLPSCTRIGNMGLHRTLPVHSQMRGCLLDDDGNVVEYLNSDDWRNNLLDGSRGQVMVEVPTHYRRFETIGNKRRVRISELPLAGYHLVSKFYVSAYEATVERSTNKLCSIVNRGVDYRGGKNNAEWDGTCRSLLGMPATSINRRNFRNYARNRNPESSDWNCLTYDVYKTLYWLFVIEYATLNSQATYNPQLTADGYRQGGLGKGVTTLNQAMWSTFNGLNPIIPCGITNGLGNGTGEVLYTMPAEFDSGNVLEVYVPRYRGVENPFGHIEKWVDGINVVIGPSVENGGSGLSKVLVCNKPSDYTDDNDSGYIYIGNESRENGYVKEVIFGERGDIVTSVSGAGTTSYFCDYHKTEIPATEIIRGVMFGGNASSAGVAGFVCLSSYFPPAYGGAQIGSRLCYIPSK